ncbi:MAG: TIGR04283 family arsenosugar biosynthesis glycosyltransferase [Methylococcaceae bacterium]|nr:TIGR04283 family arsenosugar biosynthesis glycosyltransferase [Methylococcaceae bacterium]
MISIIIPTLNEQNNIQLCLEALQPLRNKSEIIVVDGRSIDETVEISKLLANSVIISAKGRARQMNAGAEKAKGEILVFLHADTFLPENALELFDQLNQGWGRFNIQLNGTSVMLKVISAFMNWRSRITGIATGDQVIFVNKQLFNIVGGYPDIALMEDISLCAKLKKIKPPICLNAKVVSSGRRWEQFGVLKTIFLMWSIRIRYFLGENPETLSVLYSRGLFWKI